MAGSWEWGEWSNSHRLSRPISDPCGDSECIICKDSVREGTKFVLSCGCRHAVAHIGCFSPKMHEDAKPMCPVCHEHIPEVTLNDCYDRDALRQRTTSGASTNAVRGWGRSRSATWTPPPAAAFFSEGRRMRAGTSWPQEVLRTFGAYVRDCFVRPAANTASQWRVQAHTVVEFDDAMVPTPTRPPHPLSPPPGVRAGTSLLCVRGCLACCPCVTRQSSITTK